MAPRFTSTVIEPSDLHLTEHDIDLIHDLDIRIHIEVAFYLLDRHVAVAERIDLRG